MLPADCGVTNVPAIEDAFFSSALLGGGLPTQAEQHLRQAGLSYHLDEVAEQHLRAAERLAPDHEAVLIGLYRFYFYKNRLADALGIARICLARASRALNLPGDWRMVRPGDADFEAYEKLMPRFYLFTLKGYAYLNLRLGHIGEGHAAVLKLLDLDPADRIGARVLLDVISRIGHADDE